MQDGQWHPFRVVGDKEIVKYDDDHFLLEIKKQYGNEMATIVGEEARLLHEFNPSGRYVVCKAWNTKLDRELTAAEAITRLTKMLSDAKVKRQLMKEVDVFAGRK